jgi:hypothetical protein
MLFSIVKWSTVSLTLIFLVHHLYTFLMNTLTVPKIKDLVNKPKEQYKDIFNTLQNGNKPIEQRPTKSSTLEDSSAMTDELTQFFNDLKKTSTTLANPLNVNPLNANPPISNNNNNSEPLGESLTSNSSNSTYSPY